MDNGDFTRRDPQSSTSFTGVGRGVGRNFSATSNISDSWTSPGLSRNNGSYYTGERNTERDIEVKYQTLIAYRPKVLQRQNELRRLNRGGLDHDELEDIEQVLYAMSVTAIETIGELGFDRARELAIEISRRVTSSGPDVEDEPVPASEPVVQSNDTGLGFMSSWGNMPLQDENGQDRAHSSSRSSTDQFQRRSDISFQAENQGFANQFHRRTDSRLQFENQRENFDQDQQFRDSEGSRGSHMSGSQVQRPHLQSNTGNLIPFNIPQESHQPTFPNNTRSVPSRNENPIQENQQFTRRLEGHHEGPHASPYMNPNDARSSYEMQPDSSQSTSTQFSRRPEQTHASLKHTQTQPSHGHCMPLNQVGMTRVHSSIHENQYTGNPSGIYPQLQIHQGIPGQNVSGPNFQQRDELHPNPRVLQRSQSHGPGIHMSQSQSPDQVRSPQYQGHVRQNSPDVRNSPVLNSSNQNNMLPHSQPLNIQPTPQLPHRSLSLEEYHANRTGNRQSVNSQISPVSQTQIRPPPGVPLVNLPPPTDSAQQRTVTMEDVNKIIKEKFGYRRTDSAHGRDGFRPNLNPTNIRPVANSTDRPGMSTREKRPGLKYNEPLRRPLDPEPNMPSNQILATPRIANIPKSSPTGTSSDSINEKLDRVRNSFPKTVQRSNKLEEIRKSFLKSNPVELGARAVRTGLQQAAQATTTTPSSVIPVNKTVSEAVADGETEHDSNESSGSEESDIAHSTAKRPKTAVPESTGLRCKPKPNQAPVNTTSRSGSTNGQNTEPKSKSENKNHSSTTHESKSKKSRHESSSSSDRKRKQDIDQAQTQVASKSDVPQSTKSNHKSNSASSKVKNSTPSFSSSSEKPSSSGTSSASSVRPSSSHTSTVSSSTNGTTASPSAPSNSKKSIKASVTSSRSAAEKPSSSNSNSKPSSSKFSSKPAKPSSESGGSAATIDSSLASTSTSSRASTSMVHSTSSSQSSTSFATNSNQPSTSASSSSHQRNTALPQTPGTSRQPLEADALPDYGERIVPRHKNKSGSSPKKIIPKPDPPKNLRDNNIIGPRDTTVNCGLGKIKLEVDYIPPTSVKPEPVATNSVDVEDEGLDIEQEMEALFNQEDENIEGQTNRIVVDELNIRGSDEESMDLEEVLGTRKR